jgi:hypothetical protein
VASSRPVSFSLQAFAAFVVAASAEAVAASRLAEEHCAVVVAAAGARLAEASAAGQVRSGSAPGDCLVELLAADSE